MAAAIRASLFSGKPRLLKVAALSSWTLLPRSLEVVAVVIFVVLVEEVPSIFVLVPVASAGVLWLSVGVSVLVVVVSINKLVVVVAEPDSGK